MRTFVLACLFGLGVAAGGIATANWTRPLIADREEASDSLEFETVAPNPLLVAADEPRIHSSAVNQSTLAELDRRIGYR